MKNEHSSLFEEKKLNLPSSGEEGEKDEIRIEEEKREVVLIQKDLKNFI